MRLAPLGSIVLLAGCGLVLDTDPPDDASTGLDASSRLDASTGLDAPARPDAVVPSGACVSRPAGEVCRPAAGECDTPETCDGTTPDCPRDVGRPAGYECRASMGPCDVAEMCGGGVACPPDGFAPVGPCSDPTGTVGTCSGVGPACTRCVDGEVCSIDGYACAVTTFDCSGPTPACAPTGLVAAGRVCRPSMDACDPVETCDGASPACPADYAAPAGTSCRASVDECDVPEYCDGTTVCPPDALLPAGSECRSPLGPCDEAEHCDGATIGCPVDQVLPRGYPCGTGGACDGVGVMCGAVRMPVLHPCARRSGTCSVDSDCFVDGCDSEVCTSIGASTMCDCPAGSPEAICGCVSGICSWYL